MRVTLENSATLCRILSEPAIFAHNEVRGAVETRGGIFPEDGIDRAPLSPGPIRISAIPAYRWPRNLGIALFQGTSLGCCPSTAGSLRHNSFRANLHVNDRSLSPISPICTRYGDTISRIFQGKRGCIIALRMTPRFPDIRFHFSRRESERKE